MENNCIFCKIIKKETKADIIKENDNLIVIKDIQPKAPVHYLIIPKKHIETINDLEEDDKKLIGEMVYMAKEIAKEKGIKGYKLIFNVGKDGGQIVNHIHLHFLAGKLPEII